MTNTDRSAKFFSPCWGWIGLEGTGTSDPSGDKRDFKLSRKRNPIMDCIRTFGLHPSEGPRPESRDLSSGGMPTELSGCRAVDARGLRDQNTRDSPQNSDENNSVSSGSLSLDLGDMWRHGCPRSPDRDGDIDVWADSEHDMTHLRQVLGGRPGKGHGRFWIALTVLGMRTTARKWNVDSKYVFFYGELFFFVRNKEPNAEFGYSLGALCVTYDETQIFGQDSIYDLNLRFWVGLGFLPGRLSDSRVSDELTVRLLWKTGKRVKSVDYFVHYFVIFCSCNRDTWSRQSPSWYHKYWKSSPTSGGDKTPEGHRLWCQRDTRSSTTDTETGGASSRGKKHESQTWEAPREKFLNVTPADLWRLQKILNK